MFPMFTISYKEKHVHTSIVNLTNAYKTFSVIASNLNGRGSLKYLEELCEYLYVLPSKLKKTPITRRVGTTIKNSEKS